MRYSYFSGLLLAATLLRADADRLAWAVEYDEQDRIISSADPAGRVTRFTYEPASSAPLRRVTETQPEGHPSIIKRFDSDGHLAAMTDGEGEVVYRYDKRGRLASIERSREPVIRYRYNSESRLVELKVGDFYRIGWTYDFLGRITALDTPAGQISYDYQLGLSTVVRSLPNGIKTLWKRTPSGELEEITHGFFAKPDEPTYSVLARYSYTHGPDGRITAIHELSAQGEFTRNYAYDTMGRLVRATGPEGIAYDYAYDLYGNRTKATASGRPDQNCSYDWIGRLTAIDAIPAKNDTCGNLSEVTLDGVTRQYRYRPDGRLVEAKVGENSITYRYDGFGRLASRTAPDGETRFTPDPVSPYWQPLVINEPGGIRTLVIWDGNTPLATVRDGQIEWLLHDHLGSARLVADAKGNVKRERQFDAFGVPDEKEQSNSLTAGFAGLLQDEKAGIFLTFARVYVPQLGRFLQPDPQKRIPLGASESGSLYTYCGGEPINLVDLDGAAPFSADDSRIWWGLYLDDVRQHVLDATRAKETLAMLSASHLSNARGQGVAAGVTASLLDVAGGYIPGREANQGQGYAQSAWSVLFAGGGLVFRAAAPVFSGLGIGRTAGASTINTAEGRYDSALLDVISLHLNLKYDYAKRALATAFPPNYQHQFPLDADTMRQAKSFSQLQATAENSKTLKDTYSWAKIAKHEVEHDVSALRSDTRLASYAPSPVGGVYLGGAGGAIAGLGTVKGVLVDANNNLVLVAEEGGNVKLPPLRVDDLVTVFRSVYVNGEGPTVTIDPNPENPEKSAMIIRHSKATEDTYVGWVLYEADRLMKSYGQGTDNITKKDIVTTVPGYPAVLNTVYFGAGDPLQYQKEGVWERFWIVPAAANRFTGPRHELTLMDVPLKVKTQKMKWNKSKLEDDLTGTSSPGATAFSNWFTANYDDISAEQYLQPPLETGISNAVPVFAELRRIALMTAVAEKLRDDGVPMPFWMRDYEVSKVTFERFTPGLEVTKTRKNGNMIETAHLFGGVSLSPETKAVRTYGSRADIEKAAPEVRAKAERGVALAADLETAVATKPVPATTQPLTVYKITSADKKSYNAVTLPGTKTLALNPCRREETDLAVPIAGGKDIRLVRSYNSFIDPHGPWGRNWALDLPQLQKVVIPVERKTSEVKNAIAYDLLSPLNSVNARFREIKAVPELRGSKLQVADGETPYYGLADDRPEFLRDVTTTVLMLKDGREQHFTESGDLVAVKDGSQVTVYERNASGQVTRIAALQGSRLEASIRLSYDAAGRLQAATGQRETGKPAGELDKVTVSYEYDAAGKLSAVRSGEDHIGYQYDGSLLTAVTQRVPTQSGLKPENKVMQRFEYNARGQLSAEVDADGVRTEYRMASDQTGSTLTADKSGRATDSVRFDETMRPMETRHADGSKTSWHYPSGGGSEMVVARADGGTARFTESADKRQRAVELDQQRRIVGDYDAAGRLTSLSDEGQSVLRQEWHPDGSLRLASTETCAAHPEYGKDGRVTRVLLAPPGEKGELKHFQETKLNPDGRPREITDNSGLQLFMDYDGAGELKTLVRKQDEKNYGFEITRDKSGHVQDVVSSWGKDHYSYDMSGQLAKVDVEKQGAGLSVELESGKVKTITQFDGGRWSFLRDKAQAGTSHIQAPNGLKLAYAYNVARLLTGVDCGTYQIACRYDAKQRLTGMEYRRSEARQPESEQQRLASTPTEKEIAKGFSAVYHNGYLENYVTPAGAYMKVGPYEIGKTSKSFTDTRVYHVKGESPTENQPESQQPSIIKVLPNTEANRKQVEKGLQIQDYLDKQGVAVPKQLPILKENTMIVGDDVIVIRESEAPGVQLSLLRDGMPNRTFEGPARNAYIEGNLDVALKGRNMPDAIAFKPAVRTESQMRKLLVDRNVQGQSQFDVFCKTPSYEKKLGEGEAREIAHFHSDFRNFVNACYEGDKPFSETVLVHDAIAANCFYDAANPSGPKFSIIDVSDDYVGNAGHTFSIMMSQLRPEPGRPWSVAEFRQTLSELMNTYEKQKGVPLTQEQKTEVILNMAFHPYKFVTSDSKQFLQQLKVAYGLRPGATDEALSQALTTSGDLGKLDRLLQDATSLRKYEREMQQIDFTLEVLSERLNGQAKKLESIQKLQQTIRKALKAEIRVAFSDTPDLGHHATPATV